MRHARFAATLVTVATAACATGPEPERQSTGDTGVPVNAVDIETEEILSSAWSGVSDHRRTVIRSSPEWLALWEEAHATVIPRPDPPEVDFTREMVLVAAMGGRPTGGYSISIPTVKREGGEAYAVVETVSPGPTCFTTQAFTAPVVALRVPLLEGPVHWIESETRREC